MDYFNDPVPDDAVINVSDILFHIEKEDTYTEVLDNPTSNTFLAAPKNHELVLGYRNTVLHTSDE